MPLLRRTLLKAGLGTSNTSCRHFFAFVPNPLLFDTFSEHPILYSPYLFCVPLLSQPTFAVTCHHRYINQSTSLNGLPFSFTCIQPTFLYLEHLITLLLPTFTLNFLFSHTLPNSLTGIHNFSSDSATSAVSSANNSWFTSHLPPYTLSSSKDFPTSLHSPLAPHYPYTH